MTDLLFDRIVITGTDQPSEEFTAEEFLALPLHRRVKYVLQRKVQFFRADNAIDRSEALKSLMQYQGLAGGAT